MREEGIINICDRCGHSWYTGDRVPGACAKCKSKSWNGKLGLVEFLKIRADSRELEQWKANAIAGGLSLSEWVRLMLNRAEPPAEWAQPVKDGSTHETFTTKINEPPEATRKPTVPDLRKLVAARSEGVSKKRMCQHGFFYLADGSLNCPRCA